jgi:hypothetical protein
MKRKLFKRKRKPLFLRKNFWFLVLALILGGTIFFVIFESSWFQIKRIEFRGNENLATEILEDFIKKNIIQNFVFFKSQSIFLVNSKIISLLKSNFPEIEEVSFKKNFPDKIIFFLKERKAAIIFCPEDIKKESENFEEEKNCFLADPKGFIFAKREEDSGNNLLKIRTKENLQIGKEFQFEKRKIADLLSLADFFEKQLKISISEISLVFPEKIIIFTKEGWSLFLSPEKNLQSQLNNLAAVLEEKIPSSKRENLEYIDLRFGEKVFYKFK